MGPGRIYRDERGMSMVFVAVGFMAFLVATTLAIDVGMFMAARSQAQNSADAGALAGAVGLAYNSFTDRSTGGPAVQGALNATLANQVVGAPVSVRPSDVTFPNDPSGQPTRVRVDVFRTAQRSNPIPTLMGRFFGVSTGDIAATATAEASPANAETCVKPWTIPDRWIEKQCATEVCPWSATADTFDLYDNAGNLLSNPDIYIPIDQPGYTGYNMDRDKGTLVTLKPNNTNKTAPSMYDPWAIPPNTGSNWYSNNISGCNTYIQPIGDLMTLEPGNQVGPTNQGTQALIDRDPNAHWDTFCSCVRGSAFGVSPRVGIIPVYDPVYYETGKHNSRNASLKVANWIGVFVESVGNGGQVTGRIAPIGGLVKSNGPLAPGAFPRAIRLVQ
jgi:hypothetical protein